MGRGGDSIPLAGFAVIALFPFRLLLARLNNSGLPGMNGFKMIIGLIIIIIIIITIIMMIE